MMLRPWIWSLVVLGWLMMPTWLSEAANSRTGAHWYVTIFCKD